MRLRVGPAGLCACVGVGRAVWLSQQISGFDLTEAGLLLLADIPVVGVLLLLARLEHTAARRWRAVPIGASVLLVTVYLADVFAVLDLDARLQAGDIGQFGAELWVARSFLGWRTAAIVIAAAASFAVVVGVASSLMAYVVMGAVALVVAPLLISAASIPIHLQKYTTSVLRLPFEFRSDSRMPVPQYRAADIDAYRASYDALFDAPIARTKRDILLVVVESLSAVDSARTSGVGSRLDRFDDLSRRGVLFRNFLANNDASEGGIIALLSGVPPLHYPTASTLPFSEYGMQRTMVEAFRRSGYRCEFLTTVPLRFLSMQRYVQSPRSGFDSAGGQPDIARFAEAPRYAFQSPADHLLFEEVLARLDARPSGGAPMLLTAVTASSHPPWVDPRGIKNSEMNVWSYVQDELWWLYEELSRRRFFDNGLLVITGDHRKMFAIRRDEQARYGDSAKARIPLLIVGSGVAAGAVDDRLFQQSDLLRMLDRAIQPGTPLSRYAVWVNRYTVVLGSVANANNVEVFSEVNSAREAFALRLRGAEIAWTRRPPDPLPIERAIHQQRALQQAARTAAIPTTTLAFGRELTPSNEPGVLLSISQDLDLGRDPDDPGGGRRTMTAASFDRDSLASLVPSDKPHAVAVRTFLQIPSDGEYWFSTWGDDQICLAVDSQVVLGRSSGFNSGLAILRAGLHRIDVRFVRRAAEQRFEVKWLRPGQKDFEPLPATALIRPAGN
jgi:lipoteichoic acid synthase